MSEPHEHEIEVFNVALELPASQRAAYLEVACVGDPTLRQRLEALLAADEQTEELLPTTGDSAKATIKLKLPAAPDDNAVGQLIGRYKLLEKVGEGGCGVVYVAQQNEPVRRRVALKVIKLGMDTKEVIARFEAERQALAMMDHPNIAKVLDAGTTETGRPYFVMELVRGIKITDYCDQNQLSTKERLDLFIKICQAIQHAHQKGIIHRDIKPSNILVTLHDGVPVPKVIDFGIAKATEGRLTDETVYTQLHQFIGTPAYMSPEQAEMSGLDIDTRSDIYSLGVLLYELLAGSTPFDAKELLSGGLDAMRKIIREQEPVRPSTRFATLQGEALTTTAKRRSADTSKLLHQLRGDLDWIVMKCLEKDRTRRYETANGLAADLKRHLGNEPVVACPPSAAYRLQKTWRRNQTAFAIAGLIATVMVAATGISVWQAVRASRAETLAKQRLVESETNAALAKQHLVESEANAALAKQRLGESETNAALAKQQLATSEAISQFLTAVFQSPDPARDGRTITVAETLSNATQKLDTQLTNQPEHRAAFQFTLGNTYSALGLYREAIPLHEKARDYYLAAYGAEHHDTFMAMLSLASSYDGAGRRDEAIKLGEETLALCRKVEGPDHPDTLFAMNNLACVYAKAGRREEVLNLREQVMAVCNKVDGPENLITLVAMLNLAASYDDIGRRVDALKLREKALALGRKSFPQHPDTLGAMCWVANSYEEAGRFDEALKLREEELPLRLKVNGPEDHTTLDAMNNLANSYFDTGRRDEALKLREEVLPLREKVNGPEHLDTLKAMVNLANSYRQTDRRDEGFKLLKQALPLCQKALGMEHPETIDAMNNLALCYDEVGRPSEGLELLEQALTLSRKVLGMEHPSTLATMDNLADFYGETGRREEALKLREEALPLHQKVKGPQHPDTLKAMVNLAISYQQTNRRDEGLQLSEQALALCRKGLDMEHPETLDAMHNLANFYSEAGRPDEALKLREEVLRLRQKVNGPQYPDTLKAMVNLAISYQQTDRHDEGLKLLEQALPIYREVFGKEHPETLNTMRVMARSYDQAGRYDEAVKLREEELGIRRKVPGPENLETLHAMRNLAYSYSEVGRPQDAIKLGEEMLALCRKVEGPEHSETLQVMNNLATYYLKVGRRSEAIGLLEKVLDVQQKVIGPEHPDTIGEMNWLLVLYAQAGRYPEGIAILAKSCAAAPKNTDVSLTLATWQAWFGQDADYEATRRRLVQQAEGTDQAGTAERAAKAACLRPSSDHALLAKALLLARRSVELGAGSSSLPYYQLGLGLAEYRNDQYGDAEQMLAIAEQKFGDGYNPEYRALARLVRAMSLLHLGKLVDARELFSQAEAEMPPYPGDENKPTVDPDRNHDELICWLVYKEAKALVKGVAKATNQPK